MLRGEREEKLPWQEARTALQRLLTKGLEYCLNDGVVDEAEARSYFISGKLLSNLMVMEKILFF